MTDREFDNLLKTAFDRYAKETLAKIPDMPELPETKASRRTSNKRSVALILLSAACVSLLTLSVLLIAKIAGQGPSVPFSPLPTDAHGVYDSPTSNLSPNVTGPEAAESSPITTTVPVETNDPAESDSITEQIYPDQFHFLLSGQPSSKDTGEFADPALIKSELPELSNPVRESESRTFDKRTGGSYEFWSGEVQIFLQYEKPVLPIAVSFTFGNPDLLPRTCILMGQSEDGSWVELQSYTCKINHSNVTVAFYLDPEDESAIDARYTDFCLSYHYIAMPDDTYEVPQARLYGFAGEASAFLFARYYVSNGTLFAVSTNAAKLTLPDNFGGSTLHTIRRGAFSGELAPVLRDVTIPEGVQTIETAAFSGCVALQSVALPATFALPPPASTSDSEDGDPIPPEVFRYEDANGNEIICAPLTALFKDCDSLREIRVAEGHPILESRDGSIYLRDSDFLLFSGK